MTREDKREKEINSASECFIAGPLCEENFTEEEQEFIEYCFVSGAQWADENPKNKWHSIDDVPIGQHDIICKDNKGKCWHCDWKYFYENYPNWKEFVETMNVEKWIYIHEL